MTHPSRITCQADKRRLSVIQEAIRSNEWWDRLSIELPEQYPAPPRFAQERSYRIGASFVCPEGERRLSFFGLLWQDSLKSIAKCENTRVKTGVYSAESYLWRLVGCSVVPHIAGLGKDKPMGVLILQASLCFPLEKVEVHGYMNGSG